MYTGKKGRTSKYGLAVKVVLDLTAHLSNCGNSEKFLTSHTLCKRLLELGFGSCGSNRQGGHVTLRKGDVKTFHDGEHIGIHWTDNNVEYDPQ